jgi:hydrogenase maturation protease
MTRDTKSVVVLACGNTLRGDDGVAWHIGAALEKRLTYPGIVVIFTQQLLPEHAEQLSGADAAIFLDCSAVNEPGTVSTIVLSSAPRPAHLFTHHLEPESLLRLTQDLYGRAPFSACAVTVGGRSFALDTQVTEVVAGAIPIAVETVCRMLTTPKLINSPGP